jgi:hypothetical protein
VKPPWAVALAGVVAAALLVGVGRWEGSRHADVENDGIARVAAAIGPLDSPSLVGFRFLSRFQCLVYRRGANRFALEFCVDRRGRVVEAIDRRSGETKWWSLREDFGAARVRVDRNEVERLIVRMCEGCAAIFERAKTGAPGPPSG